MAEYALQVIPDAKTPDQFRWLLLELGGGTSSYHAWQASDCGFGNWSGALKDGTLALAQAAHHDEYENEATDPVGSADSATLAVGAAYASHQDPGVGSKTQPCNIVKLAEFLKPQESRRYATSAPPAPSPPAPPESGDDDEILNVGQVPMPQAAPVRKSACPDAPVRSKRWL